MGKVFRETEKYANLFIRKWHDSIFEPNMLEKTDYVLRKQKQKELDKGINEIFSVLEELPECGPQKDEFINRLKEMVEDLAKDHLKIENTEFEKKMLGGIMDVTEKFISQARKFDPSFKPIDIMQAMRNVWIMNLIQLFSGREAEYSPSVFAYSMLYPYTDNYLDDPKVPADEKNEFNSRLSRRLEGEKIEIRNLFEDRVFSLIGMIEGQYPRNEYPEVFESIMSIQHGQIKSLAQQSDMSTPAGDVLKISAEKGGTSVLADAYLVCGNLDEAMFEFAFGFGFILQLIDDLQDAANDRSNGHATIFSSMAGQNKLDEATNRLIAFTKLALDYEKAAKTPYVSDIQRMITDNCILMVFEAVGKNRKFFSRKHLRFVDTHSQISLKYLRKVDKKLKKKKKSLSRKDIY